MVGPKVHQVRDVAHGVADTRPVCYSFTHVKIGDADYRTATTDRNKRTVHSYFRTFFASEEVDEHGEPKSVAR